MTTSAPLPKRTIVLHYRRRQRDAWEHNSRSFQVTAWTKDPIELVRWRNSVEGWPKYAIIVNGEFVTG